MELGSPAIIVIALVLAAWTVVAVIMMLRASAKMSRAQAIKASLRRMQHLVDVSPAIPLLVRTDGRIEAPERLARWLGLSALPAYLSELAEQEGEGGLTKAQVDELWDKVRTTQKSASPFSMTVTLPGSHSSLTLEGSLADPQVSPGGAAIVWVFDFTASESELADLRSEAAHAKSDFAALSGLIASAPTPMWIRDAEMKLRLANGAYIGAVGAGSLEAVIEGQIELLESRDGRAPAELARDAFNTKRQLDRIDGVTIDGERRAMRVTDLPLGDDGVAGYAIDVEEQQQVARDFRAFRDAQRAMLDQLSIGVAQFASDESLSFANRPFRRHFGLFSSDALEGKLGFGRLLSDARERGQTPEVRDFPEWREEHRAWFDAQDTLEEYWPLPGGTHLRIVAQPLPDGGLVMIAEDRTEQLELSATRDTLLRTRTATLDSLFEALAIFAPDGSVQIWNRTFAATWGIDAEFLDTHPSADDLLAAIGGNLADPSQVETIGAVVIAATLDRREKQGQVMLADGRTLRFAGVPLPDGNGLLTVLDITDSQKAEQALRERAIALEEADAVKASFLANMSYEFRTPLTTIGGFAELLSSGAAGDLSDQAGEYVGAILTSVARLTEQVENVLDLSQTEAGLMPIEMEEIDLLTFLAELVRARETAIVKAGLGLDLKGRRGRKVAADPRKLGRALGNLIDNAISGTPEGGQITIELPKPGPDDEWRGRVIIRDDGSGMSREQLERAMGALPKGEVPGEGTGLGIRLAHQLVAAHGGTLELDSQEGIGTIAVITLP